MFVAESEQTQSVVVHGRIHQVVVGLGDGREKGDRKVYEGKTLTSSHSGQR